MKKSKEDHFLSDKWNSKKIENPRVDLNKYINNVRVFNRFASTTNQVIYLADYYTNRFFFVTDNIKDVFGKDFEKKQIEDTLFILKYLDNDIQKMLVEWTELLTHYFKNNIESSPSYEHFFCNFELFNADSNVQNHFFIKDIALEHSKRGFPIITMSSVQNINSLLVENPPYWFRFCLNKDKSKVFTFHSFKMKFIEGDILTPREFELLSLINKGLGGNEIAEKMNIAYSTVDNHRKNILAKIGARNPTAAIEILKNAGINL